METITSWCKYWDVDNFSDEYQSVQGRYYKKVKPPASASDTGADNRRIPLTRRITHHTIISPNLISIVSTNAGRRSKISRIVSIVVATRMAPSTRAAYVLIYLNASSSSKQIVSSSSLEAKPLSKTLLVS